MTTLSHRTPHATSTFRQLPPTLRANTTEGCRQRARTVHACERAAHAIRGRERAKMLGSVETARLGTIKDPWTDATGSPGVLTADNGWRAVVRCQRSICQRVGRRGHRPRFPRPIHTLSIEGGASAQSAALPERGVVAEAWTGAGDFPPGTRRFVPASACGAGFEISTWPGVLTTNNVHGVARGGCQRGPRIR
jgi:hypothetical protein